jgi:hypothetical protein
MQRVIAVDWSGDKGPGQRKKLWAGVWTAGPAGKPAKVTLEGGRSREELIAWLIELGRQTPRMVVGIDCCFSYPAWFLEEHGCETVFEFWEQVAAGKGEAWLHRDCEDGRFWGVQGPRRLGKRPAEFCGEGLQRMMRLTDYDNKIATRLEGGDPERAAKMFGITAKSPFQIGGSGSVGTGSLRAMPWLMKLREEGFRVWPFEASSIGDEQPNPLLVEMYTRLLTGPVKKSNADARKAYLLLKRASDPAYKGLSRLVLAKALASEDAFDALVCCLEMVRWRSEFAGLKATKHEILKLEGDTWRPGVQG